MSLELFANLEKLAAPVAAIPVLLSLIAAVVPAVILGLRRLKRDRANATDPRVESRLVDALRQLERQKTLARWSGRMSGLLVFSQFVIGGLLASSFVQDTLDGKVAGSLGVLVLLSTLLHKHYRPDLVARGAQKRVLALKRVVRRTENDLYALKNGHGQAPTILQIRQMVSTDLDAVDASEFDEREGETTLLQDKPVDGPAG